MDDGVDGVVLDGELAGIAEEVAAGALLAIVVCVIRLALRRKPLLFSQQLVVLLAF